MSRLNHLRSCPAAAGAAVDALESRTLLSGSTISLSLLGSHKTGVFDEGAAEIVAHDPRTQRLFVINAQAATVDILDVSDPATSTLLKSIDTSALGSPNSVAVKDGVVAVALENANKQAPGKVAFFKPNGQFISAVTVGALPDMLTFTPDGRYVLTANEGEPNDEYTVDPEGSVSIIPVPRGIGNVRKLKDSQVRTASFTQFNGQEAALRAMKIRITGPNATAAQDFEPEYITVSDDSTTAYVTLQENNAVAVVDIATGAVTRLLPLGLRDFSTGEGFDASDRDEGIDIRNWPVMGMYQPDAIASYTVGGQTYFITANEGDTRAYEAFNEEVRVGSSSYKLDETVFPDATELKRNENLGRLTVTKASGDADGDGDFDEIHLFGTRSFSIRRADGTLVFDSGDDFERITAELFPDFFNASNTNNNFEDRSDNKGPEPEGLDLGVIGGRTYAFIGLERVGGVMVYDVSDPAAPVFVEYVNNRDFTKDPEEQTLEAGDLGPEGLLFISADDSPTHVPLLITANEVSGSVSIFAVNPVAAPSEEEDATSGGEADGPVRGASALASGWPFAARKLAAVSGDEDLLLAIASPSVL